MVENRIPKRILVSLLLVRIMKRKKGLEAEHSERDGVQRCLFNNVLSNVLICVDCVQQECYRSLDMAAPIDTHVDVTDSQRSENSSFRSLSMAYDHTPPSITVQQMICSHGDRQKK
ncbi:hypothetical protein Tco_1421736, partial [Tanacetum coccineum]